jgi:hypothetical protein
MCTDGSATQYNSWSLKLRPANTDREESRLSLSYATPDTNAFFRSNCWHPTIHLSRKTEILQNQSILLHHPSTLLPLTYTNGYK